MKLIHKSTTLVIAFIAITLGTQLSAQDSADRVSGLIQATGWEEVQANCTKCHSAQMITQNSGNREVWKSRILWMQETQGLAQLGNKTENAILGYLAANYGQKDASRRSGLAAHLMPINPLESVN